ncbi:DUF2569 domain-containing protein [Paraburkholderia xenovorans]|uniref:DUF2569 domain-containing protein n=1 Tax=Paraburkholderia xenovorans TaxID=36873 RepID=UPI0038B9A2B0
MTLIAASRFPPIRGCLLLALSCVAGWALSTALALRDPLKLMLEWELLAVFMRPDTHNWYRTVLLLNGLDVAIGVFIVGGAGWFLLLAQRRSARFSRQIQAWLLAILVMRAVAYLMGDYLSDAIGVAIAIPFGGFGEALLAASLGIPYFRYARRVRDTFIAR